MSMYVCVIDNIHVFSKMMVVCVSGYTDFYVQHCFTRMTGFPSLLSGGDAMKNSVDISLPRIWLLEVSANTWTH